ncbi:hypothetical protein ACJW31_10G036500 [Castanea mollissima]
MASPNNGITNVHNLKIEALLSVSPYNLIDPRPVRRVLAMDPVGSGIFRRRLHVLLYYKNVSEEDSGSLFAGWAKESLARALCEQPLLSGRLRRGEDGDGELEIVPNDSGARLVEAQMDITLSEFLELKEKEEAEAQLVSWNDIDEHNPQFSPLFYVQVTNFRCGGYSVGISCSLLLADILVKDNFLNNWANMHDNVLFNNNKSQKPVFYLPNLKTDGYSPDNIISHSPSNDCGHTMHFKVTTESENLDGEFFQSLALLCIEETESKLGSTMASEFSLFVKENYEVIKIENYSKHGRVNPQLGLKTQVTCAGCDEYLGANEVAFRDGNKPMHVSYWIGSIFDGLVIAIPPLNQATLGVTILVTIPNENKL